MDKIISISDLSFRYPRSDKYILNNINLEVEKGEFIGLAGKSGCGKSTLLYNLTGIIPHAVNGNREGKVSWPPMWEWYFRTRKFSFSVSL